MHTKIHPINLGSANVYLISSRENGFCLVDTGMTGARSSLQKQLDRASCQPGSLRLIILTHGDVDHTSNSAFLRDTYKTQIAMHRGDLGMVERGDMTWNRKARPDRISPPFKLLMSLFDKISPPSRFESFTPDVFLEDGQDLKEYGIDGSIVHLPGHSQGSIGIVLEQCETPAGYKRALICGDLVYHFIQPGSYYIDDLKAYQDSIEKIKRLNIQVFFPGHGKPFTPDKFKF